MIIIRQFINNYFDAYRGLPKKAWLLAFVMLINRSGTMVLFFMTLYLTQHLDYSVKTAGFMLSAYGLGSLGGALLGGWLTDRWGFEWVQILSLSISGGCLILLGYVTEPMLIPLMLFITALIGESFRPANSAAVAEVCPPDRMARGFALNRLAINLGVAIGPGIGGFLAAQNYQYLFWVDGLTCLAATGLLILFFPPNREKQQARVSHSDDSNRFPFHDTPFMFLIALLFFCGLIFNQLFNTWPLFLKEHYLFGEDQIGLMVALNGLLIALVEMPLIHRIEKFSALRICAIGAALLFSGFAAINFSSGMEFAIFTVVIWTIGEMLLFPMVASYIAARANDQNRGKYMGMFTFAFACAFIVGPILGPWTYEALSPAFLWNTIGIMGVFVTLGYLQLERWEKANEKPVGSGSGREKTNVE